VNSKVFYNFRIEDRHLHRLECAFPDSTFIRCQSKEQFLEALPRADIVCSFSFKADWFARAPRLRRLISPTAGRDWVPAEVPLGARFEFSTFHGKIMADTVVGTMLSHARGLLPTESLEEVPPQTDHLVLCLPATPETTGMMDARRLAAESPLRNLPNCLILPHISANSPEYIDLFVEEIIERLAEPLIA